MRRVELGLADLRRGFRGQTARLHKIEGFGQPIGELAITLALRRVGHKILVPGMDAVQIGITALGKGSQQIQRRGRLAVCLDHPLRVGLARRFVEIEAVNNVAAVGGQSDAVAGLGVGRTRLSELSGEPTELDHRAAGAKGKHDRHLQQHLEHVADVVGVKFGEALGAVAALQQKRLTGRDIRQPLFEASSLPGKDQGRKAPQRLLDIGERRLVGIARHLPYRQTAPAVRGPFLAHLTNPPRGLVAHLGPIGSCITSGVGGRCTIGAFGSRRA